MKASDVTADDARQLNDELVKLKKEQFNLRFQKATGQIENTARVRQVRRDIARIRTLRSREARVRAPRREDQDMPKRVMQGVVVCDKKDKTIVVKVERRFTHPVLKKTVRPSKKYHAHDEENRSRSATSCGSRRCRPLSKTEALDRAGRLNGGERDVREQGTSAGRGPRAMRTRG